MLRVRKKDGRIVNYSSEQIYDAIKMSAKRVYGSEIPTEIEGEIKNISDNFYKLFKKEDLIETKTIHEKVIQVLDNSLKDVSEAYSQYRGYKIRMANSFNTSYTESQKVLKSGDKENANKDSALNSTKQSLIGSSVMKEYMREFELPKEQIEAHDKGYIHIHDLAERYLQQFNCCLFDMANLLDGGFDLNGSRYLEPKRFSSAINVVGDITLSASAQQYGGFTIPEFDTLLAKYAKKSYENNLRSMYEYARISYLDQDRDEEKKRLRLWAEYMTRDEIEQGFQGFETKLNTISNSLGQIPFVTITFGMDTSYWGKTITRLILKVRRKGMGENRTTAIFPKLVFLHRKEINGNEDSPNYDLFNEAIRCSSKRLYPDYLSLDNGNLKDVYDRTGLIVSPMGW